MASLKNANRMVLDKVEAWRDPMGRWHVVCNDPDVRGAASIGLHLAPSIRVNRKRQRA